MRLLNGQVEVNSKGSKPMVLITLPKQNCEDTEDTECAVWKLELL